MRGKEEMKKKQIIQSRAMKKMYALSEKRSIDLSLSENPLGCSPMVFDALKRLSVNFNSYPPPNGKLLKTNLAKKFSLAENNIFIANGSESIISDFPRIFCNIGDEVLIPALSFPMFSVCSELVGAKVVKIKMTDNLEINLPKILEAVSEKTRLIFICNPNNPTGSVLAKTDILKFISNVPKKVLVVIDEANIEFGGESMIDKIANLSNLVVLRTFSKGFGLASLRIAFAVADKSIVQSLEEETPIFPVSGLSEQLACIALKDEIFLQMTKQFVSSQRKFLKTELESLGFTIFPSEANNIFVKIPSLLNADQFIKELEKKDVSLINGINFEGYDNSFFRVSVRDKKTNQLFIKKMGEIINESM